MLHGACIEDEIETKHGSVQRRASTQCDLIAILIRRILSLFAIQFPLDNFHENVLQLAASCFLMPVLQARFPQQVPAWSAKLSYACLASSQSFHVCFHT